jgi:hypothetical protein
MSARPVWFPARRRGQCAGCAGSYGVGTLIQPYEPTGGWLAECCDPDVEELARVPVGGVAGDLLWARLVARAEHLGRAA